MTIAGNRTSGRARVDSELYAAVAEWLIDEAALLDNNQFEEWVKRLAPDVRYVMPVRETVMRFQGDGVSSDYSHFEESFGSLAVRVKRLSHDMAWAENPPSRTRRFVTNIRASSTDAGDAQASSYLLLLRNRVDSAAFEIASCERRDVLRADGDGFLLVSRQIVIDQATLGLVNLSVFL